MIPFVPKSDVNQWFTTNTQWYRILQGRVVREIIDFSSSWLFDAFCWRNNLWVSFKFLLSLSTTSLEPMLVPYLLYRMTSCMTLSSPNFCVPFLLYHGHTGWRPTRALAAEDISDVDRVGFILKMVLAMVYRILLLMSLGSFVGVDSTSHL